ncbi:MAG TPA: hypothetical protein VFX61_18795 [Micromonosporaceae bacterium]|nr:hypothetical protein [Micromonosporaceae bacterium]
MQPRPPRIFRADEILTGRVVLTGYPFRYIYITPSVLSHLAGGYRFATGNNGPPDQLLSAVELLETQGWELVNVDISAHLACMRRIK